MPSNYDTCLKPVLEMSVEELIQELEALRRGRTKRVTDKAKTTRVSTENKKERDLAMKIKAATPDVRKKVADKLGVTLEELDRRMALVK